MNDSARVILFLNPVTHPGVNLTVRRGRKWSDTPHGTELSIRQSDKQDQEVLTGRVVGTITGPFDTYSEIFEDVLGLEHDPACRTREGLEAAMRQAYPDFEPTDEVTFLFFVV